MSTLGDFLETVFGPNDRFETLNATIHHWCDQQPAQRAGDVIGRRKLPNSSSTAIEEVDFSVWVKLPDRFRVERSRRMRDGVEESIEIISGNRSWQIDHEGHCAVFMAVTFKVRRRAASRDGGVRFRAAPPMKIHP